MKENHCDHSYKLTLLKPIMFVRYLKPVARQNAYQYPSKPNSQKKLFN